jgi:hypothetical protein
LAPNGWRIWLFACCLQEEDDRYLRTMNGVPGNFGRFDWRQ